MLRQGRSTFAVLAACVLWLCSAHAAPAQGFGRGGGKGPAHPGFGGTPNVPGKGANNQKPSQFGQQPGGKTNFPGFGNTVPNNLGRGTGGVNQFNNLNSANRGTTGVGTTGVSTTTNNSFRGNAYLQSAALNRLIGASQPATIPAIQSGVLPGPYGMVNLVGNWAQPLNSNNLLTSLALQNSLSGLNNPLLSSGFNNPFGIGNYGLFGQYNPFGLGNNGLFGVYNPFGLGNNGLFGQYNPFGLGNNGLFGQYNPFGLGNNGLFGQYNPFGIGNNALFGQYNPFGLGNNGQFGLYNPLLLNGGLNSINYWGNPFAMGTNPLLQSYYNNPLGMNLWNSPFTNPFANPFGYSPFGNPWMNQALPGAAANPLAPAVNNPFNGFRLF